ncbi:hypothetical protein O988_08719 [Pseudogymnoascus sp. VKM F-3808]|nr:hypothetical protein O988_08719 [Pseudogymnoascus sp. VKM F-3808]
MHETRPKSQESKGPELHGGVTSAHNNRTFPPHQHRQGFKAWRSLALLLFQNREIDTPHRPSGPLNLLRTAGTVPTKSIAQYGLHVMTLSSRVRPILPTLCQSSPSLACRMLSKSQLEVASETT